MANNPIGEPMLTGSDSDEVSSANPVHAGVPALERHLLTQMHVRLQDKLEECEGEPEEPPPPAKRAPPFHPSTSPSSMTAEVEELVEALEWRGGEPCAADSNDAHPCDILVEPDFART